MKKVKLALSLLALAALGIVYHANQEYFLAKQSLDISLHFDLFKTPEIANGLYFLGCFLTGLILALIYAAMIKYRSVQSIKGLNVVINEQNEKISELKDRVIKLESSARLGASQNMAPATPVEAEGEAGESVEAEVVEEDAPEAADADAEKKEDAPK